MKMLNDIKENFEVIIDKYCIHVINYKKIKEISYSSIIIELFEKDINIKGKKLLIKKMNEHEILVTGTIKGIDFIE